MAHIPSIFLVADADTETDSLRAHLAARGHGVTRMHSPLDLLKYLQGTAAPELIVIDTAALLQSSLGVVAALKAAVAQSGAVLVLLSDLGESLTGCAAYALGAHAAAFRPFADASFAELAESLCERARESASDRAVAAALRKEAAPRSSLHSGYPPIRA